MCSLPGIIFLSLCFIVVGQTRTAAAATTRGRSASAAATTERSRTAAAGSGGCASSPIELF